MATQHLANWASGLQYSDLPSDVTQAATRCFYNWAGCAIGGSNHPTTQIAYKSLEPFFGKPTSTLLGHHGMLKTDPQHAALINGIASHVHDYDDTHLETIIHPTGPVASALLAYSEHLGNVDGKRFILALVAGIEAECKAGLAVWPAHYDIGWHITSSTGSVGAAVAIAKLLFLDTTKTAHAIGIAATQVTGLREMFGSDTKSFHPGRAAQSGLLAAVLASNGYTSSLTALEAKRGWANVVSASNELDKQMGSLGKTWEITKNAYKPFPCGIVVHPIIDGCIQLHADLEKQGKDASAIKSVHARVHHLVLELTGKKTPQDGLQAKFSVYHGAAVGLVLGKAGPAQYDDAVVRSEEVVRVRDKVTATVDKGCSADETWIELELEGGGKMEKHISHALGSLEVPMEDGQLEGKFVDQCEPVIGREGVEKANKACWGLERVRDVGEVAQCL